MENREETAARPQRRRRKRKSSTDYTRKVHRWLGVFIGTQFVLWTVGGLYFSWTELDEIRGDHLRAPQSHVASTAGLASPSVIIDAIRRSEPVDSLAGMGLVSVLGQPTSRVDYFTRADGETIRKRRLADAARGVLRPDASEAEAVLLAKEAYAGAEPVRSVEYPD